MTPERWRQVERVYHAALEREPSQRAAFLAEACDHDESLRSEVESLLAQGGSLLEHPPWENPRLKPGDRLGPYEILAPIGAGGMGEVWRARDTRLHRDVAIKFSKEQFSERFEREARAVAALNHANICQLYDVGTNYLVMELVEGETLQGPLPLDATLDYARQIAEALEAAHEKGIIHRDLKPANVKITPQGVVKVLDFGLAAIAQPAASSGDPSVSPTLTISPTVTGTILGTAAYMSPEQARGKPVDKRADIWAFGVVLYEMLTGRQLFCGETITDVLASVVKEEPDLTKVPLNVRRLLRACLEKNPKERLQAIGDWHLLLDDVSPSAAAPARTGWLWPAVAALLLVGFSAVSFLHFREKPPAPPELVRFQVAPPEKGSFTDFMVLSPDGRKMVYSAIADGRDRLWIRSLDSDDSHPISGSDGGTSPFWSPDSRFVAFADGNRLKKTDISGGAPQTLCEVQGIIGSGTWSPDGVILFGSRGGGIASSIRRVPATGGIATLITQLDSSRQESFHSFPAFLPDGRHFLYSRLGGSIETSGVYVGSLDSAPERQSTRRVLASPAKTVFVRTGDRTGKLLFLREGTVLAQSFDTERLELSGDPAPVAEQVGIAGGGAYGLFTASAGTLAYRHGSGTGVQLTWFDRKGKALGTVGESGRVLKPAISPDGRTVAIDRLAPQAGFYDIWLQDLQRGTSSRLTFGPRTSGSPVWSPDGSQVAFYSNRDGVESIYRKSISGVAPVEALDTSPRNKQVLDWSRDGRYIIESVLAPKTNYDIWVLPLFGDRKPYPYLQTEFNESGARLSPNGRWLAYASDETGQFELYVQSFPTPGGKWQVSINGGSRPVWSRDGKELYYIAGGRRMMAVEVKSGAKLELGVPQPLFEASMAFVYSGPSFDVSSDGRFLIPTQLEQISATPMTVVLNWASGLK